ncbi:MAG TPA: TPM domain-containing protein [Caulobacteraceae bacterium]|nr:TPM domain-containing protein [Caulobacteraceae bacterium]
MGPGFRRGERWLGVLLALVLAVPALAAPTFPKLTGRVVDNANILSPQTEAQLTQKLSVLEQQTTRQVVVVTLPSLQGYEIEEYGYQLGRTWQIGQKGEDNGALLIVAPNERKVRIEVGYGLEPVLTDALSSVILQQQVLPRFRAGDMEGGVVAGANAVIAQLALPEDEARSNVQAAAAQTQQLAEPGLPPFAMLFIMFFIFMMLRGLFGGRRRRRGLGGALPWIILAGMSGGGRGGFGGGGGSFGGGGSSGGW